MNKRLFFIGIILSLGILFAPIPYYISQDLYCESNPPRLCQKAGWHTKTPFALQLLEQKTVSHTANSIQQTIIIQVSKNTFKHGESIQFTIFNNTSKNVYYYGDSCASRLVNVMSIDQPNLQLEEPFVCMLAPSVDILLPNNNLTNQVKEEVLAKMVPGRYKLRFDYSWEIKNRFSIGERTVIESEPFILVE